jgi:poly-gamma-glutamate capsule biosynthesis protein CapA/YwtB (metallophosphatase superfamily)
VKPVAPPPLHAPPLLAVLATHRVEFVIVGGFAAMLHGATRPTSDLDTCPATDRENLERLTAALRELRAGIRVDDLADGLPFDTSADALAGVRLLNLRTRFGELDLTFAPAGTDGYPDLARHAQSREVGTVRVRIASLEDVIRSKTAAGRGKDLDALPELRRLAARQREPE